MYCMITTTQSSCTSHTHTHTQLVFPAANSSNIYYTFNEGQTFQVQSFSPSTIDPRSLLFSPTQLLWAIGHDIVNKKVNISLPTNIQLLITTMLTSCVQQNWFGHRYVQVHKHGSSSVFSQFCMADVHFYLFHQLYVTENLGGTWTHISDYVDQSFNYQWCVKYLTSTFKTSFCIRY